MREEKIKIYKFNELSDEAKETAIENWREDGIGYGWWDCTYEDAEQAGLKLTEFDIDRGGYCKGDFVKYAENTANKILAEHGEECETYQTATDFINESAKLLEKYLPELDEGGYDENESERDEAQQELDAEFLRSILEDYRIMLQNEYEYLNSDEAISETIECNEYEFTEDGGRY